jgi:uncharacterized DUF497 family protein
MNINFEWDPVKAASNLAKHKVSFAQSVTVFNDARALTMFDAVRSGCEKRV